MLHSMMKEEEWARTGYTPSIDKYLEIGVASFGVDPILQTVHFFSCVFILLVMYSTTMVVGATSSFVWTKGTSTSGSHLVVLGLHMHTIIWILPILEKVPIGAITEHNNLSQFTVVEL
eukprot:Gb_25333 [translate_table: standard]